MNISGAEAVVAAASPWVGQGESACLVRPYVDIMTESELHLSMTSGECHIPPSPLLQNRCTSSHMFTCKVSPLFPAQCSRHTSLLVSPLRILLRPRSCRSRRRSRLARCASQRLRSPSRVVRSLWTVVTRTARTAPPMPFMPSVLVEFSV